MSRISNVYAGELLDTRGSPTVEVEIALEDGTFASALVPSFTTSRRLRAVRWRP